MRKILSLTLVFFLAASCLLWLESGSVQAVPKPSVPQFTVQYINHPYDVAQESTIDQYTGETVVTNQGGHYDNWTIEITIKNQLVSEGYRLFYDVEVKGHFGQYWSDKYPPNTYTTYTDSYLNTSSNYLSNHGPEQSDSQYTVFSLPPDYPDNSSVDFRVEAVLAQNTQMYVPMHPLYPQYGGDSEPAIALVDVSEWSPTQTLTLVNGASIVTLSTTTPSPSLPMPAENSTATPTLYPSEAFNQPQTQSGVILSLDWEEIAIVGLVVVVAVLAVGLVALWRRLPKK